MLRIVDFLHFELSINFISRKILFFELRTNEVRKKGGKRLSMIISYEIENVEKVENLTK